MLVMSIVAFAVPQDDETKKNGISAQPVIEQEHELGDTATQTRWKVQKTVAIEEDDLKRNAADLRSPDNVKQEPEYNDTLGYYVFGTKVGGSYIDAPIMMTPGEFMQWSEKKLWGDLFAKKNAENFEKQGKDKFDFADMHFNLGPAEKIFGPGGVRVTTQGTAELKFGVNMKNTQNPSLPIRRRKTTGVDFDMKINMNMQAKVGDKVNMNLNYNTDATFNYDAQNMKLKYEGKEDEIIKLVEAGNVSFPSNSSLVKGASSLFGIRTDWQFGKLKLQTVVSQKKSASKSVSSKGGVQMTPFEIDVNEYEENRHFFLSHFFHDRYDTWMKTLPNLTSGITINRVEIWVTNTSGNTNNTRNIIALTDLAEAEKISRPSLWYNTSGTLIPDNAANNEYKTLTRDYPQARDINQTSAVLEGFGGSFEGGIDFEKLEKARLLSSSEYTLNQALGYVTLSTTLRTDQVLAVAYEYTYAGQTYQVGEFASDLTESNQALFVKSLKNTSNNPEQGNWRLMMKNAYKLASQVQKEKFRLDVKYQSDTTGVYISYIPEQQVKSQPIIKLLGADRLDNNNRTNPNGYFDFVEGYTVNKGTIFFPVAEPFGQALIDKMTAAGVSKETAEKYAFTELYDSTRTKARQIAEKDKFMLVGQYKGSRENVISLGAYNVPQGSVVVTAGGMTLVEGSDYTVDYSAGEVTIINQSLIDAGTNINVSLESNTDYGQTRKTMLGMNWEYDFSKDFQISGTLQHLSEQALTNKVAMGSEPLNNTLWGVNINWKKDAQWLTKALNAIPFLHVTQPSSIQFQGEFAQLIAGKSKNTQDNASYIDDFDYTKQTIDVSTPSSWILSSVPQMMLNSKTSDKTSLESGYQRAKLAWYNIDPLFTRSSSSLTPAHIKSDLEQLSNYYVREVYVNELYPNRDASSYTGATSTLALLDLAYYPTERGPYNFNRNLNTDGTLLSTAQYPTAGNWGGMMRKLDTTDFESANIGYIEFWMLDPFIYQHETHNEEEYGGDLYFNLGDISEDVLLDGKKFYESGMPVDGTQAFEYTQWGKVPTQPTVTYAFATTPGSREKQDVGFDGLTNKEEHSFHENWLNDVRTKVGGEALKKIEDDPSGDDYHYFRGADFDEQKTPILERYKNINNPQGNSPDTSTRKENYDTSYKTTPDVEDINQDYTLNEYDKYYQYRVSIRNKDLVVGENYIVDKRVTTPHLRNGKSGEATWYKFRIPVEDGERVGNISDLSSIRFMRMFMTGFEKPIILRFGSLDLVRGDWRIYTKDLDNTGGSGRMEVSSVSIEENTDKQPVNYTLPPGIRREQDPSQPQLVENDEQSLQLTVDNLSAGESKCVYKTTTLDLRQYKRLQMFVHANANKPNITNLKDDELSIFVRLGSDYKNNYYEYEIPLKLTEENHYDQYSYAGCQAVWPKDNMLDIETALLTNVKKNRNKQKSVGQASYNQPYSEYDDNHPNNRITVMGNPSLGEVKTMIIGIRNKAGEPKSGEVWVNELRMLEYDNSGGWAAQGNLNVQMSDFGTVNVQGKYVSQGFGGLEDGVAARAQENFGTYTITTQMEMGKFFPEKAKVTIPVYYSVSNETSTPKYNPLDTDMRLKDALESSTKAERDSISSIAVTRTKNTNFSISNMKVGIQNKKHPTPIDPANFSFSYSHSHKKTTGETTVYETEDNWRGAMNYSWTPVIKALEPWKKSKVKSKWMDIAKQFQFNWLPQNISFGTDINRTYYELQERDMETMGESQLPLTFSKQFLWNREFSLRWDFTKNIHMTFSSATHAEVEEPYTPVNKALYPDEYAVWKDSIWSSIKHLGTPLDYSQSFSLKVQSPLDKLPALDWTKAEATYKANYSWLRGSTLEDGTSLGNTITNTREISLNGTINMEKLYNHVPFLKKVNDWANSNPRQSNNKNNKNNKRTANAKDKDNAEKQKLNQRKKGFEKEIKLMPDSVITVNHGRKTKRIIVTARTENGKLYDLKYKIKDDNTIAITSKVDTATNLKISVVNKPPLEEKGWYKAAQYTSRILMMLRNMSISYRNNAGMSLPGFMPMAGDAFGQKSSNGSLAPGFGFAFGLEGEEFIEKARERDWLLYDESVATPATINKTEDIQLKMTVEPWKNFKIDLNATRVSTHNKSIQYMYEGTPTTQSGSFNITTISLKSAFDGIGNANNGYYSKSFERFCKSLPAFQQRVDAQYGGQYSGVKQNSADVLIPAFLASYTNMKSGLSIFPALTRMLPNWSMKFSGLGKLPWIRDHFKSVNLNHSYKSVYAVGSYSSFSTYQEYMNGLGTIVDATTGDRIPSSPYNVSTVSINESFAPLFGLDMTFNNNLTVKAEYKTTRVLTLSTTSVQINESSSKDWVIGCGYKIQDFKLFGKKKSRRVKGGKGSSGSNGSNGSSGSSARGNFNHDLNLRFDFSFRKQAAITRDIATMTSAASSGNNALKFSFNADYTISKLMTMSFYFDRQTNTPLLSSSSYPTTTQDFGLSIKFSLRR